MLLFATFLILITNTNAQDFLESPESQMARVNTDVVFRCRHSRAETIRWSVNGSLISGNNPPPDITPSTTTVDNHFVNTLTIVAHLEYNKTEVVCVAKFDDGSPDETTDAAILTVIAGEDNNMIPAPSVSPCYFNVAPSKQIVPVMTQATFKCQSICTNDEISENQIINWNVNKTLLNNRNPLNVTTHSESDPNGRIHTLSIAAISQYNVTVVECIILYLDGIRAPQASPSVNLLIQGRLPAVSNFKRHPSNSSVTWTPPYSLNLTNVEPDIAYCIDVYNITCGKEDLVLQNCTTEPKYSNTSILQRADLFQIDITPRSNKQGAVTGIKHTIREKYIHVTGSAIGAVVRLTSDRLVDAQILLDLTLLDGNIAPDSFVISLESVNDRPSRNFSARTKLTSELAILDISGLPYGDRWYCTIYADRCGGMPISDVTTLSTFDVTNASVSANSTNGKVKVSCGFIEGSEAAGVLVIAYSTTDPSDIHYQVIPRNGQQSVETVLSCLPGETYNVLLFVISKDGLPLSIPATQLFPASVNQATESNLDTNRCADSENEAIVSNVYQQGDSVCIECYFTDKNDSCVVIVHQNISQLNLTKESLNISLIHLINRTNDSEKGHLCIPGINLYEYQVGVIPLILNLKQKSLRTEDSGYTLFYIIGGSVIASTALLLVCVQCIIGWRIWKRRRTSKSSPTLRSSQLARQNDQQSGGRSEDDSPNTKFDSEQATKELELRVIDHDDTETTKESGTTNELPNTKESLITTQLLVVPKTQSCRDSGFASTPMEGSTNNATPVLSHRGSNVMHNQTERSTIDELELKKKLKDEMKKRSSDLEDCS